MREGGFSVPTVSISIPYGMEIGMKRQQELHSTVPCCRKDDVVICSVSCMAANLGDGGACQKMLKGLPQSNLLELPYPVEPDSLSLNASVVASLHDTCSIVSFWFDSPIQIEHTSLPFSLFVLVLSTVTSRSCSGFQTGIFLGSTRDGRECTWGFLQLQCCVV